MAIEKVAQCPLFETMIAARTSCVLAEGIIWDQSRQAIWWVDIEGRAIHRLYTKSSEHRVWPTAERPTALALTNNGCLLVAMEDRLANFDPDSGSMATLRTIDHPAPAIRLNDGACDRAGNFWVGSMDEDGGRLLASLYRYTPDGDLRSVLDRIGISNGIAFSPDDGTLYFADSAKQTIRAWTYDAKNLRLYNERLFCDGQNVPGVPDGATVDKEGFLWSARWDGWCIIRYAPDGRVDLKLDLPVQRPTKCAFGGERMSTLYVTSARIELTNADLAAQPLAGSVLAIETPYQGIPEATFANDGTANS